MSNYRDSLVMRRYPPAYAAINLVLVLSISSDDYVAWQIAFLLCCLGGGLTLGFAARAYRVVFPELSWWGVVRCRAPLPGEPYPRLSCSVGWVVSVVGVVVSCGVAVWVLIDGSGWALVWCVVANGWVVVLGWCWERPESIVRSRSVTTAELVVSPAARVVLPVVDVGLDPGWPGWGFVPGVALVWSRVGRGDGLVWLRWVVLAFGHGPLVVAGLGVLLSGGVSGSGVWRPGLAVVVGVVMVVVTVCGVVGRRGLSCVGLWELRAGYVGRLLWRAGCGQVVVFVGLFGFLFSGVVWLVVVGVVVSGVLLVWVAPTRWRLGRDQRWLDGEGCGLSLVVALRS